MLHIETLPVLVIVLSITFILEKMRRDRHPRYQQSVLKVFIALLMILGCLALGALRQNHPMIYQIVSIFVNINVGLFFCCFFWFGVTIYLPGISLIHRICIYFNIRPIERKSWLEKLLLSAIFAALIYTTVIFAATIFVGGLDIGPNVHKIWNLENSLVTLLPVFFLFFLQNSLKRQAKLVDTLPSATFFGRSALAVAALMYLSVYGFIVTSAGIYLLSYGQ